MGGALLGFRLRLRLGLLAGRIVDDSCGDVALRASDSAIELRGKRNVLDFY